MTTTTSVDYATAKATVDYDRGTVLPEELLATVAAAGYEASLPAAPGAGGSAGADAEEADATAPLRQRLLIAGAATAFSSVANALRLRRFRSSY